MPRSKTRPRRAVHWWTEEIAELRRQAVHQQRISARHARKGGQAAERAREGYLAAKVALRKAIKKAKGQAWTEFIDSLNEDPWGRPYKMVLNKLRPWAPPLTERLDAGFVQRVVRTLFPEDDGEEGPPSLSGEEYPDWDDSLDVQPDELRKAVKRGLRGNTAPGPDGLHKKVHLVALRNETTPQQYLQTQFLLLHKTK
ncbi:PREDICTED: uncharacterized protein LOC105556700 [Vollenhovia emeryi]|uniref:uncharacterized protein LOC105556700 n=1 Tax=Vollenhovia emeryi TaxID=411798 RepID=UPI0005F41460|nr:PREDICTED: uncharacterized protein LOC105556700 [Vollenhovia emeryi]